MSKLVTELLVLLVIPFYLCSLLGFLHPFNKRSGNSTALLCRISLVSISVWLWLPSIGIIIFNATKEHETIHLFGGSVNHIAWLCPSLTIIISHAKILSLLDYVCLSYIFHTNGYIKKDTEGLRHIKDVSSNYYVCTNKYFQLKMFLATWRTVTEAKHSKCLFLP